MIIGASVRLARLGRPRVRPKLESEPRPFPLGGVVGAVCFSPERSPRAQTTNSRAQPAAVLDIDLKCTISRASRARNLEGGMGSRATAL